MALNPNVEGRKDSECTETGELRSEKNECRKNSLSAATSATTNQNGDPTGCGDGVMPNQEASDRRRSGQTGAKSSSSSPLPGQRPVEELPRRNFQIPRKIKERKGLYQFLPPDSREFEDLLKILSSFYLDSASRGTFSYCKARLIHNELLEKEFIEKRRELKQEGRTEAELAESFCFLFPDKAKLPWICEKGLSVGHSRITTLGNPSLGVYLSKYSDLLQINPFDVGACGDIVVFKVMRGRLKHIHENMPKSVMEPTPKTDCHVSKNANRVTSLLSYRAFEQTQQYFCEFAFNEIKPRPRHVCPYALVSFQYVGKEAAAAPMSAHRFNMASISEGSRGKRSYTVWTGPLMNKGQELFQVCLRSSTRPYLPFKLPDKLDLSRGMQLDQVKRKIPAGLFSWDTYCASREVLKCGMSCSLFEVVDGKGKATTGSLPALINKLERDRMVLVQPLLDKGFLFLLSSTQMVNPTDRRGRVEKSLQALFVFQESRGVVKYNTSRLSEPEPLSLEPQPADLTTLEPFVPALYYALLKLRSNPGKDLSLGVERQVHDYLTRKESSQGRTYSLPEYVQNLDDRGNLSQTGGLRSKPNAEGMLRSYLHCPATYALSMLKAKDMLGKVQPSQPVPVPGLAPAPTPALALAPAPPVDYSPVSDWGGSVGSDRTDRPTDRIPDRAPEKSQERLPERVADRLPERVHPESSSRRRPGVSHSNGGQSQHQTQPHRPRPAGATTTSYDEDKMKQLLKLIRLHKKALVKEPGKEREEAGEDGAWDPHSLKRKLEGEDRGGAHKYLRSDNLSNGESSRAGGAQAEDSLEEGGQSYNLAAVMESMGIYDTDLRDRGGNQNASVHETQRLLKVLLATLSKAMAQKAAAELADHSEPSLGPVTKDLAPSDPVLSKQEEPKTQEDLAQQTNYIEPAVVSQPEPTPAAAVVPPSPAVVEAPRPPVRLAAVEEPPSLPSISLDTILNQEVHSLTSDIKSLMQSHHLYYTSQLPPRLPPRHAWLPNSSFSYFVRPFVTPVPVQAHVKSLSDKMGKLIPEVERKPAPPPVTPAVPTLSTLPPPPALIPGPKTKGASSKSAGRKESAAKDSKKLKREPGSGEAESDIYSPAQATNHSPSAVPVADPAAAAASNLLANSLIGQLKPEMFSSLVEIFKDVTKNTVKFYIHSGDEGEESQVCREIKDYLMSLGNSVCKPQTFLENSSSMDKLLIIIQNEDIAAHVHKIPALVSLKKLSSVSFAGVDSLDDVKNHTYNELFVSGGFIVSDEFVLNPDLITQDRLQSFLKFLEEQSTPEKPWQWKVHCKSQKKLKELGRLNSNAMGLLNLLTAYQKKHLVEFLPYHECDTQSRQAPELDCLVKLQAQHTQQRHMIFLTERPFEMFLQYSRNGIVIASIDDIMTSFHSLTGSINQSELPTPPSTAVNEECDDEECVEGEDMSLDSDDGEAPAIAEAPGQGQEGAGGASDAPPPPPLPETDEFRPPLPDQQVALREHTPSPYANSTPTLVDFSALKTAISQFKATTQGGPQSGDMGGVSPGGFAVNPHQSFLCPSGQWATFPGPAAFAASPAYPSSPCSSTTAASHEQDPRPPVPTAAAPGSGHFPMVPLANLGALPREVKPPPPPHLMYLTGYSTDTGGAGAAAGAFSAGGNTLAGSTTSPSPQTTSSISYSDPAGAQHSYMPGGTGSGSATPSLQGDGTLSGPGDAAWGVVGNSTCESQDGAAPGSVPLSGVEWTEAPGSNTPVSQGGRTPVNCVNSVNSHGVAGGAVPLAPTRGGSVVRPKLPPYGGTGLGGGYGCIGSLPGQMESAPRATMGPRPSRGYRGRAAPPGAPWPRPGRGHDRGGGGGPCTWGYPVGRGRGQDYYSDYAYSHSYTP
ncbi:protein TASOR [Aplochiton taeniatus]